MIKNSPASANKPNIAIFSTILIILVLGSIVGYSWFTNEQFRNVLTGKGSTSNINDSVTTAVENLGKSTKLINTDALIYDTINFRNLPVYPKAWVEKYFQNGEALNQLVSAPDKDPDADGLTNKEEYFYASNPKNKDTLCDGKQDGKKCVGKTDKQLIDEGISPLTGLELVKIENVRVKKQDYAILNKIQDSFENASREGVDFPTLYQLSKSIDLTEEYKVLPILTQSDDRENLLNYINFRVNLLQDLVAQDQVSLFTEIYQSTKVEDIKKTREKYAKKNEELRTTYAPERFESIHRSYIFFFDKIIELLDFRADGIEKNTLGSEASKKINQEKAVAVVWAYRLLNENLSTVNVNDI